MFKLKSSLRKCYSPDWVNRFTEYLFHKWPWICCVGGNHSSVLIHDLLLATRVTWQVPLVEQEQLIFLEHLSSPSVFSVVCCSIFNFLCSVLWITVCPFCPFCFDHWIVSPPIYGFWLPRWYLQTFCTHLINKEKKKCFMTPYYKVS